MTERITHEFWDFIEKYLPNYYHRDDIARQSDLQLFIEGQESSLAEKMTVDEAEDELHHLLYNICIESIDAYTKGLGNECQECESTNHFSYCPICGKKHL
jgi:hypothetical protein